MAKGNWIQGAVSHPGALRKTAAKMGLVKQGEPLSDRALETMHAHAERSGNTTLMRMVQLAHTLKGLRRAGHKD